MKRVARAMTVLGLIALIHLVASFLLMLRDRSSSSSCWMQESSYDGYNGSTCITDFWPALGSEFTSFDVDKLGEYVVAHFIGLLVTVVTICVLYLICAYIVVGWYTPSPVVATSPETPVCRMHDDEAVAYCNDPSCPCPEHRNEVLATVWIPEDSALQTSKTPVE